MFCAPTGTPIPATAKASANARVTNVRRASAQTDVTEEVQAKFRGRLVTPLGPYAERFGDAAPGAEKTLKVKLHYWRQGVVKYVELPQDSALDLTGR